MGQQGGRVTVWCAFLSMIFIMYSCIDADNGIKDCDTECCYTLRPPEGDVFQTLLADAWYMQVNLVSWDTVKILALFTPWYLIARHVDNPVHCWFYRAENHTNQCQWSSSFQSAADKSALGISLGLAALSLNWWDCELARAARVYASGLVPIWIVKNIFKTIRHDGCVRPKCEFFDRNTRYYGGCPSGHMAFITYATTFFGLHYGPWAWVPLGAASVAIFCNSVNSNRHYVSQLIAGTALGLMYGVAAHKVIDAYNCYDLEYGLCTDDQGKPALGISYSF